MGSRVHETLEKVYTDKKFQKVMTLEQAQDYLKALWQKNWNDEIIIVRKEYGKEKPKSSNLINSSFHVLQLFNILK